MHSNTGATVKPIARKEKEVWQACDELSKEGEKITYQQVGDRLLKKGLCRGSNSDLCRYISTWRNQTEQVHNNTPSSADEHSDALIKLADHQQLQFNRLFNALQAAKKANQILQKKLYESEQENKRLKQLMRTITRGGKLITR